MSIYDDIVREIRESNKVQLKVLLKRIEKIERKLELIKKGDNNKWEQSVAGLEKN